MQKPTIEHIGVVLDVLPVPESIVADSMEQFVSSLNQDQGANCICWFFVLSE